MSEEPKCEVKTTKLRSLPFKNMKNIKSHTDSVNDCTSVLFPDGKMKLITCSFDKTIRIFDLLTLKCEKIIKHSYYLYSVHFYEEKQLLMTTDQNGELCFWNLFSTEIKIIKRIKVSKPVSILWKLTQVSSDLFFCCVCYGSSYGCLYSIKIKNLNEIKIKDINYPYKTRNKRKEPLRCIYKLKSENSILFAGGSKEDHVVKKFNYETKKHSKFPKKHRLSLNCLISYINEKNEEIILSGSRDKKILFWNLIDGQNFKEIEFNSGIYCFLNDFRRNNIFITTGYPDYCIYSLNLKTKKIVKNAKKVHTSFINYCKWINEESQNKFISCSADRTFNIFELEKFQNKYENEDLKERINFLRDEEFIQIYFFFENNKKNLFSIRLLNKFVIKNVFKVLMV